MDEDLAQGALDMCALEDGSGGVRQSHTAVEEPSALHQSIEALLEHAKTADAAAKIVDEIVLKVIAPYHRAVSWGDRLLTLDKSAAFKQDPRFQRALEIATGTKMGITQYAAPDGIVWRINTLVWAAQCALFVPGDLVECGVFMGDMSFAVCETFDFEAKGKTFYLYDTFEGLSDKYSSPDDFPDSPQLYDYFNSNYRINGLYEQVCARFAPKPFVKVIKGVVPDVLHEHCPERVSYLHLDMNSPLAELGALTILFDRVSPGGIVVLDDYGWADYKKQKDSADRFMDERGYRILEMPTGQGLLVKR